MLYDPNENGKLIEFIIKADESSAQTEIMSIVRSGLVSNYINSKLTI